VTRILLIFALSLALSGCTANLVVNFPAVPDALIQAAEERAEQWRAVAGDSEVGMTIESLYTTSQDDARKKMQEIDAAVKKVKGPKP
jgi:hypothetical protein